MISELVAGDTLDFLDTVDEYPPADGWTLKYQLIPRFTTPAQSPITITATTSGTDYRVQAAAAVTAGWKPGAYTWARWVEKVGPIRQSLGDGQLLVKQDPAAAVQGYDGRSMWQQIKDTLEGAFRDFQGGVRTKSYTIGSRSMTYSDHTEMIKLYNRACNEVRSEDAANRLDNGLGGGGRIQVRF